MPYFPFICLIYFSILLSYQKEKAFCFCFAFLFSRFNCKFVHLTYYVLFAITFVTIFVANIIVMENLLEYLFNSFDYHDSRNHVSCSCSSYHHNCLEEISSILNFIRNNIVIPDDYNSRLIDYCSRDISYRSN